MLKIAKTSLQIKSPTFEDNLKILNSFSSLETENELEKSYACAFSSSSLLLVSHPFSVLSSRGWNDHQKQNWKHLSRSTTNKANAWQISIFLTVSLRLITVGLSHNMVILKHPYLTPLHGLRPNDSYARENTCIQEGFGYLAQ